MQFRHIRLLQVFSVNQQQFENEIGILYDNSWFGGCLNEMSVYSKMVD